MKKKKSTFEGIKRSTFAPWQGNDTVNHPKHYTAHPSGIECIQVTEHMNFNLGNAVKYIWRCGNKGREIEDLKKAEFYIHREIQRLEKQMLTAVGKLCK